MYGGGLQGRFGWLCFQEGPFLLAETWSMDTVACSLRRRWNDIIYNPINTRHFSNRNIDTHVGSFLKPYPKTTLLSSFKDHESL